MQSATPAAKTAEDSHRHLSLEHKLPLLITGVLVVVLAVSLALTHRTLLDAAESRAATRLSRAARQLAGQIERTIEARAAAQRRVAADSAIQRVLVRHAEGRAPARRPDDPALGAPDAMLADARAALARLTTATDSGLPIELWTEDGHLVVRVGGDPRPAARGTEPPETPPLRSDTNAIIRADSTRVSTFYTARGRVYFGIATPVHAGGRRIGFIAQQHRVAAQPRTLQGLRELIGEDVTAYYANMAGTFWSTVTGEPSSPPDVQDSSETGQIVTRSGEGPLLLAEAPIGGTPWAIALELPRSAVLARPMATMLRLALLSTLLVAAGAAVSWVISRRITRPLASLSAAANALAAGDDTHPIDARGGDEIARLAQTFIRMRQEVVASRTELEEQVEEAQAVAEELEQANEQLREATLEAETARDSAETARARLAESETRFRTVCDTAPVLIWTSDAGGRRDWFNRPWLDFIGRSMEEEVSAGWTGGVHPDDVAHVCAVVERSIDAREPFTVEYRLRRSDGEFRWLLDRGIPRFAADRTFIGLIGSAVDIADRREVEERMRLSEAVLREAKEAAELANRAKSDFLAVMSHELRTPLNAIGGYAQLLELGVHGPVTDAQREALTRLARSQQRLLTLINDVLNFAKLDAGQVHYELRDVPLSRTLVGLEAVVAPQVRAKQLVYSFHDCSPALTAYADADKVEQVLLNLLSNAIKFTPAGGRITVECEADERAVRVHVRDTGVGIPADRVRTVFEPFVQGDRALNRPNDGVGLGLAISRDLARGMGGDLMVESVPGEGSTFTLVLPRAPGAAAPGRMDRGTEEPTATRG